MLLKLLVDRKSESTLPPRVSSSREGCNLAKRAAATCAQISTPQGGAFTCVSGGDAGGAEAGAHSYLSGARQLPQLRYL